MFQPIDPESAVYQLKFKFRDPTNQAVRKNGSYKPRTGNSHGKKVSIHVNVRPRMRSYYGAANHQSV